MSFKEHPFYEEEARRLAETIDYVKNAIISAQNNRKKHNEEIKDAYVDLDFLDSSQSYVTIMLHSTLLDDLEKQFDSLLRAKEKPYFARIDFRGEEKQDTEKFYIGKMSLFRPDYESPVILDWRSPLASVYYDGRIGEVSYQTDSDTLKGELSLKRQYTIENGTLQSMMDIDITANDTFLQASLGEHKDNKLKDIVSTIQAEQNAIIRADIGKPLIVQGAAGSGKTTIALHRIAYLIYTYEKSFFPENFMIIAPNRLFINYIADVLPELGADRVKQTTYIDYALELIGTKYKISDMDEKLLTLVNQKHLNITNREIKSMVQASKFKGSMDFKNIIESYILEVEQNFVPQEDFVIEGYVIYTVNDIENLFIKELAHVPIYKRLEQIKKYLTHRLKSEKVKICEAIEKRFDDEIDTIRKLEDSSEERRVKLVKLMDERDLTIDKIKKKSATIIKQYMQKFPNKDVYDYYRAIITDKVKLMELQKGEFDIDEESFTYLCNHSKDKLDLKKLELEDLAALLFLKHKLFGFDKEIDIKYVVIDEAQDFSCFQFYVLKEIFSTERFTILGDLSQGIHSSYRGIENWNHVTKQVFHSGNTQFLTLKQSYRTTIEIMNLANKVISLSKMENLILAEPVVRHGEVPQIIPMETTKQIINAVEKKALYLKKEGYKSIAIIGKTPKECKQIQNDLKKSGHLALQLLDSKEERYDQEIVIVPSYLAKGLEFDATIIVTLEDTYYENELDVKLLYVAMTRALHQMHIYYKNGTIPLLEEINNN